MFRRMRTADVPQVARIHKNALPNDFLPGLGEEFLQILHRAAVGEPETWTFVFVQDDKVKGFVMGTVNFKKLFLHTLLKNWLKFFWIVTKSVVVNPQMIFKALETFLYPIKEKSDIDAELVVIAVAPGTQGKGIGSKLVKRLEQEFKKKKVREYKVTTLQEYEGTNRFYKKLGFRLAREFRLYGKGWNLYIKNL